MEALTILFVALCFSYILGVLPAFIIAEVKHYRNETPVHYHAEDTMLTAAFWPLVLMVFWLEY
jgi:hypothetical protein